MTRYRRTMPTEALLERDEQLRALRSHLTSAASGCGAIVFVEGEAGVGKSALVRRFCADVAASATLLIGGCDAMQTPRPLGPLRDMAPDLGPPFTALLDDERARDRVFGTLLEAFRTGVTVAVFEDVHWADEATLDLLRFLGRRLGDTRTLAIATFRRDELGPLRHPLRVVLGDLASGAAVHRLRVSPLSRDAVARLAQGVNVDPDDLHRITAGNPFFVTEVVAAGGERLPISVSDAVNARVGRLPGAAREALEAASVLGLSVEPNLLAALGHGADAVEACSGAGVLHEVGDRLAFRHQLARDAIRATIGVPRRRALHAAALAALERVSGTDRATLAHHAAEAGDADAVLRHAPIAAREAAALGAHREARAQYARVLPYLERLDDDEHTEVLEAYAHECELTDRLTESVRAWQASIDRWRAAGHVERWARALARLSGTFVTMGDNAAADANSVAAIEALEALGPSRDLAAAYAHRAHLLMMDRANARSIEWGRRAIDLATSLADDRTVALANMTVSCALMMSDDARYVEHFERSVSTAREHGYDQVLVGALGNRGSGAGELYRFDEAERYLREALEVASANDFDRQHVYGLAWLATVHLHRGAWDEAATTIAQVLGRSSESAVAQIMALVALGRLRVRRGDPEAWPPLDEALELALRTGTLQRLAPVRAARAEAAWFEGDLDRVRDEATACFDLAVEARHPWFVGELGYWRWLTGDRDDLPPFAAEPFALQVRGAHREAAAAWEALGCPFETARALAESADVRDVREAVDGFTRLGARVAAERARARLHELGATRVPRGPRERTRRHPAGLTPREAQVLTQLAEGMSNAEIAARHRVSTRTVEHQVSSVLSKLGVDSRTAAVAEAHRRGLVDPT